MNVRAAQLWLVSMAALAAGACFAGEVKTVSAEQFLAGKETDFVGVVTVTRARNAWVNAEGDMVAVLLVDCRLTEPLRASKKWPAAKTQCVLQVDYGGMVAVPIAPPARVGKRYVLWAVDLDGPRAQMGVEAIKKLGSKWMVHPQGLLLVRGRAGEEFVYWAGKRCSLAAIRKQLKPGTDTPLDRIRDPARRLEIARFRLEVGRLGDVKAFVRGLLLGVTDAEKQVKLVRKPVMADPGADPEEMGFGQTTAFSIRFESLFLLHALGEAKEHRASVVAALTPVAQKGHRDARLLAAAILADLGSNAGRKTLKTAVEAGDSRLGFDPETKTGHSLPFPCGGTSRGLAAYSLSRLGEVEWIKHRDEHVRAAAAAGLAQRGDSTAVKALTAATAKLDKDVEKLRAGGDLARERATRKMVGPGGREIEILADAAPRVPPEWIRLHGTLAARGNDGSLRKLVEVWIVDFGTYPRKKGERAPREAFALRGRPAGTPSLFVAIFSAGLKPPAGLARLKKLFGKSKAWDGEALRALRGALSDKSVPAVDFTPKTDEPPKDPDVVKDVTGKLASADPKQRMAGLARACEEPMLEFFDRILEIALTAKGTERQAAIFYLGVCGRDVPPEKMRKLLKGGSLMHRLTTLEVATRRHPEKYAAEAMALVGRVAKKVPKPWGEADDMDADLIRANVIRVLSRLPRHGMPKELLAGLKSRSVAVRWMTVSALGMVGDPAAIPALKPLLKDRQPRVRAAAKRALLLIGPGDGGQ